MKRLFFILSATVYMLFANPYSQIDEIIENSIQSHIFPGASVIVGTADSILYHHAYGQFTCDAGATPVDTASIFGLASLTKVFATSMCMMKCIDSGLVSDEDYVKDWVAEFNNNGKGVIKVKHLLMHNSGLPAYTSAMSTPEATLNSIYNISMSQSLGIYTYSCLNFIMTMRVVEEATGMPMWQFYKQIYTNPMQLQRTMFCPPDSLKNECLPTTRSIQGTVHDPLAAGLDGLSGNAGLFSTTGDLAKLCQMMLHYGTLNGHTYVDSTTIIPFTTLQSSGGSRAYGWGINGSSAGSLMSDLNYGHTGYTGTSAFIDPTRELFVILLTNRVYPDDNTSVTSTRQAVADAAVRAFEDLPGQPRLHTIFPEINGDWTLTWDYRNNIDSVALYETINGGSEMHSMVYPSDSLTITIAGIDCICPRSVKLVPIYKGREGDPSDTYYFMETLYSNKFALIVDGYDRVSTDLGWNLPYHSLTSYYGNALPGEWGYTSCDNQAVIDGDIALSNYDCVLWFCGDESVSNETFSSPEQAMVKTYLENGGHLFVSGSEIGYDLSYKGTSSDVSFYHNYLKTKYLGDDSNDLSVYGTSDTQFEGISFTYGGPSAVYQEDYPDMIYSINGSKVILLYSKYSRAGIAYIGSFGTSLDTGKVISLGFPFETIEDSSKRNELMGKIIQLFESDFEVSIEDIFGIYSDAFELSPAYPNPFNPTTTISFNLPKNGHIQLLMYNLAGKCVDQLINNHYEAGSYSVIWNAADFPSGVYFCKLTAGKTRDVLKLILMK